MSNYTHPPHTHKGYTNLFLHLLCENWVALVRIHNAWLWGEPRAGLFATEMVSSPCMTSP